MTTLTELSTHAEAFAQIVREHGDAPAIVDDGNVVTYSQLLGKASYVARQITTAGTRGRVAVLSPNCSLAASAFFGICGAGAASVLLDPANPESRLIEMLRRSDADLLIAHPTLAPLAQRIASSTKVKLLATFEQQAPNGRPFPIKASNSANDVAIVFTSGSTGHPKGCVESEADSLYRCQIYGDLIGLGPGSVVGVVHHFSGSRMQPNSAFLRGAAVAYYNFAELGLGPFAQWMQTNNIDSMRLFPTTFRQLCEGLGPRARLPTLRTLVLTGEAVHARDVQSLRRIAPDARLLSVYSSTESGPMAAFVVEPEDELPAGALPLGYPLPGQNLRVCDTHGLTQAVGVIGELVLQSRQIFRGYADGSHGDRLSHLDNGLQQFSTGDQAFIDPRGLLIHAGRKDNLVKVRGHRIELAEVENALRNCRGVIHAAATTFERQPDVHSLIAYVVLTCAQVTDAQTVRAELALMLPMAMLPTRIEILSDPPLGTTGKLQKDRLPAPSAVRPSTTQAYRDPTHAALAAIWGDVLGVRALSPEVNFFEAGGDSLMAATVLLEVEALFGVRFRLSIFASHATISSLASAIGAPGQHGVEPSLVPIRALGSGTPIFVIAGIRGHTLRFVQLAQHTAADVPMYGLQPPGLRWPDGTTIEDMATHYLGELSKIQPVGSYRIIGASFGGLVAFELVRQLEVAGAQVDWLCMFDTQIPGTRFDDAWKHGLDPDSLGSHLVAVNRYAQASYQPDVRLRTTLHYVLALEYPVQIQDQRDWRSFFVDEPKIYPVVGIHGAFHAQPQRAAVSRLIDLLVYGEAASNARTPAEFFDYKPEHLPLGRALAADLTQLAGAIERVAHENNMLRVTGHIASYARATSKVERLVVFIDDHYAGWTRLIRAPRMKPGQQLRLTPFDIKIARKKARLNVRIVALSNDNRVLVDLRCSAINWSSDSAA